MGGPRTQTGFQGDSNYKVLMSWMSGCPLPATAAPMTTTSTTTTTTTTTTSTITSTTTTTMTTTTTASDNWTTFLFEHIFDENTGLWTNRWSANGVPVVAVSYSIQNFPGNYQLGFTNNPEGGFISDTALRNFWYKEV